MAAWRVVPRMGPGRHRPLRGAAAGIAAMLAGIHLDRMVRAAREAAYLGLLFAVAGVAFGWVAWKLFRTDHVDAWLAGAALGLGVGAGYALSCTVGLPGLPIEHWSGLGDASAMLAAAVSALAAARSWLVFRESR